MRLPVLFEIAIFFYSNGLWLYLNSFHDRLRYRSLQLQPLQCLQCVLLACIKTPHFNQRFSEFTGLLQFRLHALLHLQLNTYLFLFCTSIKGLSYCEQSSWTAWIPCQHQEQSDGRYVQLTFIYLMITTGCVCVWSCWYVCDWTSVGAGQAGKKRKCKHGNTLAAGDSMIASVGWSGWLCLQAHNKVRSSFTYCCTAQGCTRKCQPQSL